MNETTYSCYALKNKINGKIYVGVSGRVEDRIKSHMGLLKNGTHTNKSLQDDYDELHLTSSDFEIYCLEENIPDQKRTDVEFIYIMSLKTYLPEVGYNCRDPRVKGYFNREPPLEIIYGMPETNIIVGRD